MQHSGNAGATAGGGGEFLLPPPAGAAPSAAPAPPPSTTSVIVAVAGGIAGAKGVVVPRKRLRTVGDLRDLATMRLKKRGLVPEGSTVVALRVAAPAYSFVQNCLLDSEDELEDVVMNGQIVEAVLTAETAPALPAASVPAASAPAPTALSSSAAPEVASEASTAPGAPPAGLLTVETKKPTLAVGLKGATAAEPDATEAGGGAPVVLRFHTVSTAGGRPRSLTLPRDATMLDLKRAIAAEARWRFTPDAKPAGDEDGYEDGYEGGGSDGDDEEDAAVPEEAVARHRIGPSTEWRQSATERRP